MVDITLLELHVDDANATFSAGGPADDDETEVVAGEPADDAETSGPPLGAAVVGLIVAVVVAFAVRKFVLGGERA